MRRWDDIERTLSILDAMSNTVVGAAQDGVACTAFSSELRNRCGKNDGELRQSAQEEDGLADGRHFEEYEDDMKFSRRNRSGDGVLRRLRMLLD